MPAFSGEDSLVPPTTIQPPYPKLSYSAAPPALGSAAADTSVSVRKVQLGSCCHDGLVAVEQPAPAWIHTDSVQPRCTPLSTLRDVPPTETTEPSCDGKDVPLTVITRGGEINDARVVEFGAVRRSSHCTRRPNYC